MTTRLAASSGPKIVDRVRCVTTPGETIDVVVTENGVAVHPGRAELREQLLSAGLDVITIDQLRARAVGASRDAALHARPLEDARVVGVVEYRDGRVTDVIRQSTA